MTRREPTTNPDGTPNTTPAGARTRTSYTDSQRRALRQYAFSHPDPKTGNPPAQAQLVQWWFSQFGNNPSQSVISHMLSPKYAYLDGPNALYRPEMSRKRDPSWPQLEAALWEWQMDEERRTGNHVTGEMLRVKAKELFETLNIGADGQQPPNFSAGWLVGYRQRHGLGRSQKRARNEEPEEPTVQTPDNRAMRPRINPAGLTQRLLNLDNEAFNRATEAPFLVVAGQGQLTKSVLSRWLSQDRLYAQSYVSFIGALLTKIRLPVEPSPFSHPTLPDRIVDLLTNCLTNIRRELNFFSSVASKYGLSLSHPWSRKDPYFRPSPTTRAYMDFWTSVSAPSTPLIEGLVALWATEKCYYSAWLFAQHSQPSHHGRRYTMSDDYSHDLDGGALRKELIPNWTNADFGAFVQQIAALTNELARVEGVGKAGWQADAVDNDKTRSAEEVWRHVLYLEERFWPSPNDHADEEDEVDDDDDDDDERGDENVDHNLQLTNERTGSGLVNGDGSVVDPAITQNAHVNGTAGGNSSNADAAIQEALSQEENLARQLRAEMEVDHRDHQRVQQLQSQQHQQQQQQQQQQVLATHGTGHPEIMGYEDAYGDAETPLTRQWRG